MKKYNELTAARMNTTSALLASLPQIFTAKEYNAMREEKARENSGMHRSSFRYIPREHLPYTLDGLREVGVVVIAFTDPLQIEVDMPIHEVFVRSTGESLFIGTDEECEKYIGQDWRHLGMRFKDYEEREITIQRHHYSVNPEAYRAYIRETFGTI